MALYDAADRGRLRHRRTELVELAGTATELPGLAGEPLPAAVFVNAGDWALAQVTIDRPVPRRAGRGRLRRGRPADRGRVLERRLAHGPHRPTRRSRLRPPRRPPPDQPNRPSPDPPAAPRPVAASAWSRLTAAGISLAEICPAAIQLPAPLTPTAVQALLGRALTCADRYVPRGDRAAVRTVIADAALRAAEAGPRPGTVSPRPGPAPSGRAPSARDPLRRALLIGFAASAQTDAHLAIVRALLDGDASVPDLDPTDLTLRAALVRALATRGLARPGRPRGVDRRRPGGRASAASHLRGGATGPGRQGGGLGGGAGRARPRSGWPAPRRRASGSPARSPC